MPELHKRILALIPIGHENAITITNLIEKLGLKASDRRTVNYIIDDLIYDYGYPIGTNSAGENKGIFFMDKDDDLQAGCRALRSRAVAMFKKEKKIIENYHNRNQLKLNFR